MAMMTSLSSISSSFHSIPPPPLISTTAFCSRPTLKTTTYNKKKRRRKRSGGIGGGGSVCNLNHFSEIVRRDVEFLKKGISKKMEWANQIPKAVEDVFWLRNLQNPNDNANAAPSIRCREFPQPYYPELSGVDLLMADIKALEAYITYYYYLSKIWSKPIPQVYDPQEVSDYFNVRPHVVALRLLQVFGSFASAAIRIRTSGIITSLMMSRGSDSTSIDDNISQYNFGMVLKETMLQDYQYASDIHLLADAVGQSLSTRPDIIGTGISKALSELHDQIPPFPRKEAMKIIEEELGLPVDSVFRYISEEPVAAASFGQVYRGCTLDGSIVAVKVQRPNLRHVVVRDVYILRVGLGLLQKIAKRKNDLRLYADELGKGLVGELDYTLEAANALQFQEAHSRFSFMRTPKVFRDLTRKRVLTMEWMNGDNPKDLLLISTDNSSSDDLKYSESQKSDAKRRLLDLASKGVESTLVQLLETGLLHADPHPGNIRYMPSGQIGFLDFGLLCKMEKKHQFAMLASIVHIVNGDWASLVLALTEMDVIRPGTNIRRVTLALEDALDEVELKEGIPDVKFSRVLGKIWSVALKYHFRMPPYYTLLLRCLASLEGMAVAADPDFKTFEAAYPYVVRKLLSENSAAIRKILHSVVFNKKKEFRWQRVALFLKVGTTRNGLLRMVAINDKISIDKTPNRTIDAVEVANLVLRLLPSENGAVLRRLLMTVDGASLVRSMVSEEAILFRQQFCRVIADVLYEWMFETLGQRIIPTWYYSSKLRMAGGSKCTEMDRSSSSVYKYKSLMTDRRMKVIFLKIFASARKDPILMLRFYWASFVTFIMATALACHRFLVSLSEAYLSPLSFAPRRFAVGA
ncbi:hypothetical protein ACFE04_028956 [Oxalis oulophora]